MHVSSSSSVLISSLQWRTPSQHLSFTHFPVQFACPSTSTSYARDRSKNEVVSRHPICLSHNLSLPTPFSSSFLLQTKPARPFLNGHGSRRRKNSKLRIVSAVFERFTERAIKAVIFSQREAKALGRDMVFTQHLLLGLIAEEEQHRHLHPNSHGFLGSGITMDQARRAVRSIWRLNSQSQSQTPAESDPRAASGSGSASDLSFSISTKRVLEAALEYSRSRAHNFIAPEHIVIGLLTADDGSAGQVLKRLGVNVNQLLAEAASRLQIELAKDGREPSGGSQKTFSKKSNASSEKKKEKSALEQFCVDLTARASEGLIDPVIGRDSEVQRIIQILCRRTKNNPILLGESGVGKTAIVEGLATSIAQADVPVFLLTKRVMSLDVALLMAGAKERGELETRVTTLISDVQKSGNIILFIDEVHTLIESGTVGRGNKGSGLDIANIMKPALGRGKLQCIASTTTDEYRMHLEKDKAFGRRFQPVWINEPSQDDAVKILLGLREKYEAHHNCIYAPEAISAAVYLSARYIPDRYLPDKAIDLIDEAGSRARMEAFKRKREEKVGILSKSPDDYWQEIRTVQAMHEVVQASELQNGAAAATVDDTRVPVLDSISSSTVDDEPTVVGPNDIAAVASLWSGVPLQQLTADDRMLLVGLDEKLSRRVVGQEEAVAAISRAVRRSRVGLKDPSRPMAAMLFCGPTGVGKTELTKALAASYFGSEEAMVRLDMSEYMERHSVSKLIGSPPGYVGYGEGGTLTEAIRRRPFTVVVLDEIEKAHPDIFNILLQIFEDGHLTDSQGRRVSFKNALVVMTSNVGSTIIAKGRKSSIGFLLTDNESSSYAGIKATVMEELKAYFRPELLNRIDEVVVFHPLEKAQMLEIVNIMLQEVKQRLMSLGIGLEVSESVKDLICHQGYDRIYGARPLRRAITQIIEDPLSESLLAGVYQPGDTLVVDLDASGNPCVRNGSGQSSMPLSNTVMKKIEELDDQIEAPAGETVPDNHSDTEITGTEKMSVAVHSVKPLPAGTADHGEHHADDSLTLLGAGAVNKAPEKSDQSSFVRTASTRIKQELKKLASFSKQPPQRRRFDRMQSAAAPALQGLKFISKTEGNAEWPAVEKRFDHLTGSPNGMLPRAVFGECIGMNKDSKEFAGKLFDALARKHCIKGDSINKEQLRELWGQVSEQGFDSRLQIFFDMVDKDGDGRISVEEVKEIISFSASANKLSNIQKQSEEYAALIMEELDPDNLGYIMIDSLETLLLYGPEETVVRGKESRNLSKMLSQKLKPVREDNPLRRWYSSTNYFLQDNWQRVWVMALWIGIMAALFAYKYVQYKNRAAYQVMGYCVAMAKGAAETLKFNMALILLPVCRNTITLLRNKTKLGVAIPFDDNLNFHKVIAIGITIGAAIHSIYHLSCDFPRLIHAKSDKYELMKPFFGNKQPSDYWYFLKSVEGVTGIVMVVLMAIAFTLAAPCFRRGKLKNLPQPLKRLTGFNAFWYSHHLFVIVYTLLIVHGQYLYLTKKWYKKTTWMYLAVPLLLYGGERLVRALRSSIKPVKIVKVALYPGNVLALHMSKPQGFRYHSGQYMFVNCAAVSPFEWHPFSITSAPGDDYLSVHIRTLGDWTRQLKTVFSQVCLPPPSGKSGLLRADCMQGDDLNFPRVLIDGPYGAPAQDYKKYEVVLLVGLGIGATPMISILKDIVNNIKAIEEEKENALEKGTGGPMSLHSNFKTKRAYFYWVTREQGSFDWFKGAMNEVAELDHNRVIEFHNYCTSVYEEGDARSALIAMLQSLNHAKNGVDIVSGTRVKSHFAKPNWREVYKRIALDHTNAKVGVFYCGPPTLTEELRQLALDFNHKTSTRFEFHKENF